ncbi:Uncharacterised protein [Klebsiella pneumoniae]|uniref:Uncharacterized protein n=1 Tax=Klebsiella pneumoniae TaxID=573 RepID=A0A2X3IS30_KLEPN|nr:Uncharacterised protein [Klebsiella pneumoniae]
MVRFFNKNRSLSGGCRLSSDSSRFSSLCVGVIVIIADVEAGEIGLMLLTHFANHLLRE